MRGSHWGNGRIGRVWRFIALGCCLGLCATTVSARTVYRWVDKNGVLNFSHSPPPDGIEFDTREQIDEPAPTTEEGTPGAKVPGHVTLTSQSARQVRPEVALFSGTVVNDGAGPATRVVVGVTVTETETGTVCLKEDVPVTPEQLAPNETGTFSAELEVSCFGRSPKIDMVPTWE